MKGTQLSIEIVPAILMYSIQSVPNSITQHVQDKTQLLILLLILSNIAAM